MANFAETDSFNSVEVIETTDLVLGGDPTAVSNKQAKSLTERTAWLKARLGGYVGVSFVSLSGSGSVTLTAADINKAFFYSLSPSTAATYAISLPSPNLVKAGSKFQFCISDSDTSILKVTVGGEILFNNEIAEAISNGVDSWTILIKKLSTKTKIINAVTEDMGSSQTRIRINSITDTYFMTPSHPLTETAEIKLLGDIVPRSGQKFKVFFNSDAKLIQSGNIRILNQSTTGGIYAHYQVKTNDFVEFIYGINGDTNWYVVTPSPSYLTLYDIVETANVTISAAQDWNVRNWINKLIATAQSNITRLTSLETQGAWVSVSAPSGYDSSTVFYRANRSLISFKGAFIKNSGVINESLASAFPVGARPVGTALLITIAYGGGFESVALTIQPNGTFSIAGASGSYTNLSMDNVNFYIN